MKKHIAVLLAFVCLAGLFSSCTLTLRKEEPQTQPEGNLTSYGIDMDVNVTPSGTPKNEALYAQKHPYIGREPQELRRLLGEPAGLKDDGIAIQSVDEPYGITLYYVCGAEDIERFQELPERLISLQNNALVILALIENCGYVQFALQTESTYWQRAKISTAKATVFRYDIAWADKAIGGDIKKVAETQAGFTEFYDKLAQRGD
ncbi:MAG: DUF4825 domain-containing protein [Oscillospiraceae bacterium]|jgi:hypothetical protein|nr:DUF4825 domain-containing protein [Oscillospiraceae bacterium]